MIEVLLSLVVVGMLLGLVAKGYQTVSRLNEASYRLSQKLEAATFLRRLSAGMSSASVLTPLASGVRILKTNPAYNVLYNEPFPRLPWPITPTPVDLNAGQITVNFTLNATLGEIRRQVGSETSVVLERTKTFTVTRAGRVATVLLEPEGLSLGWSTKVHLPGVAP